jgi:hypothetical protein
MIDETSKTRKAIHTPAFNTLSVRRQIVRCVWCAFEEMDFRHDGT